MTREKEYIHEPNKYLKLGFISFWKMLFDDLRRSYNLGWRLFVRDFVSRYKQRVLGVLWVLIIPLVAALSFTLLANSEVLQIQGMDVPYPIYVFVGVTFWNIIQGSIISLSNILNDARSIILQVNFPRVSLLISPFFTVILNFFIQLLFFFFICFFFKFNFPLFNIFYILCLIPAVFIGIGIGMLLAIIGAVIKDIGNIITYLFQFLLLVTPIVYPRPENSTIGDLASLNPLYYLVVVPRDLFLFGSSSEILPYFYFSLLAVALFFIGWRFYTVAVVRITEKV